MEYNDYVQLAPMGGFDVPAGQPALWDEIPRMVAERVTQRTMRTIGNSGMTAVDAKELEQLLREEGDVL